MLGLGTLTTVRFGSPFACSISETGTSSGRSRRSRAGPAPTSGVRIRMKRLVQRRRVAGVVVVALHLEILVGLRTARTKAPAVTFGARENGFSFSWSGATSRGRASAECRARRSCRD